jgi:protein-S-isoprenylcysteine O-methyltransferase Ste14
MATGLLLSILGVACFPVNPLVLSGVLETRSYPALVVIGWVFWSIGMVLVLAPMVMFPRRGGVPKGKTFVHTTKLVDTGAYALVRHPQYLGGMLAIFVTALCWYPHWLFAVLGVLGVLVVYLSCRYEEARLLEFFGEEYGRYMEKVPRLNIAAGLIRWMRRRFRPGGSSRSH